MRGPIFLPDPVVRDHPLAHGLVSWWLVLPGLDGGRQWADIAGLNHGTLTNMTTSASGWRGTTRPGGWGHLLFDGSNDYVNVPYSAALDFEVGKQFTLSVWVQGAGAQETGAGILCRGDGGGGEQYCIDCAASYRFITRAADNLPAVVNSGVGPNGSWEMLTAVFRSSEMQLYHNGVLKSNGSSPSTLFSTNHALSIGSRQNGNTAYDLNWLGGIDSPRVYNRALSAAEVRALYDESRTGYPTALRRLPSTIYSLPISIVARRSNSLRAGSRGAYL